MGLIIEIKRIKSDGYKVVVTRDGERQTYDIDSPELKEYVETIQFQLSLMESCNAGSVKLSLE